MGKLHNEKVIL